MDNPSRVERDGVVAVRTKALERFAPEAGSRRAPVVILRGPERRVPAVDRQRLAIVQTTEWGPDRPLQAATRRLPASRKP